MLLTLLTLCSEIGLKLKNQHHNYSLREFWKFNFLPLPASAYRLRSPKIRLAIEFAIEL